MKAYTASEGTSPLILQVSTRWKQTVSQPHNPAALPPSKALLLAGWVAPSGTLGDLGEEKLLILRATVNQMVEPLA